MYLHTEDDDAECGGERDKELLPDAWPTSHKTQSADAHERHATTDGRHHQNGEDPESERSPRNDIVLRCMDLSRRPASDADKENEVQSDDDCCDKPCHQTLPLNLKPHKKSTRTIRTNAPATVKTVMSGNPSIIECEMSA